MKIRTGFVSNSSSSSFICDVSGEQFSGYDASASDFDLEICEIGHTFLNKYVVGSKEIIKNDWGETCVKSICCPICTLKTIKPTTTLDYLLYKYGLKLSDVENEIRQDFKSLDELRESME